MFEADLVKATESQRIEFMEKLTAFLACNKGGVPALVGTQRERMIKELSGNHDPYQELKSGSNALAKKLLPLADMLYTLCDNKLEALIRIAAAANSMEFGVKGHNFDNDSFGAVFSATLDGPLDGDLEAVKDLLLKFKRILYITDNAGEVIFDLFVVDRLIKMGYEVVIASKSEPILNDVTAKEISKMTKVHVIESSDVVGLSLERSSDDLRRFLSDPTWLIIAKGMGNYETISEFEDEFRGRLIYILRAKCEPVARSLKVKKGTLVVRPLMNKEN
jgi:uncharacterized protein with ATP-grasp and redox domains